MGLYRFRKVRIGAQRGHSGFGRFISERKGSIAVLEGSSRIAKGR